MNKMHEPWRVLVEMDADVALLQEVGTVPEDVLDRVELSPHIPWLSHDLTSGYPHYDRWPMVVKLPDRVRVEWFRQIGPTWVSPDRPLDESSRRRWPTRSWTSRSTCSPRSPGEGGPVWSGLVDLARNIPLLTILPVFLTNTLGRNNLDIKPRLRRTPEARFPFRRATA